MCFVRSKKKKKEKKNEFQENFVFDLERSFTIPYVWNLWSVTIRNILSVRVISLVEFSRTPRINQGLWRGGRGACFDSVFPR